MKIYEYIYNKVIESSLNFAMKIRFYMSLYMIVYVFYATFMCIKLYLL
jgi:hypothetical protein